MTSQIEKLHTLNLFAKSLRDSRITMKTYLFDFQKSKDKDFETDFPTLSVGIENFIGTIKDLTSINSALIPSGLDFIDLIKISKSQLCDFYIEINGRKVSIFAAKNKYEKVMYYIYRITQKGNSESITLEAAFEQMRNKEYSNYSEVKSFADTLSVKIDKLSNLIITLHKVMKELSTLQVQIYTLKSVIISNCNPVPIGYQFLDQTYNYILFQIDGYIFHQPTRFSTKYLSDVLGLSELSKEYKANEQEQKISLSEAFTLFSESKDFIMNEFFKVKYGIEINRLISYEILNNWIYDDEKVNEITHSDIFLPDSDDNSSVFI
ncbi:hypothetical protein [Ruminococcus intestinalis]|uniref:hypothetical protein n=1 Tax=Ruminococcus intestinalis TaxID=2763066 RepID=UPI003F7D3B0A